VDSSERQRGVPSGSGGGRRIWVWEATVFGAPYVERILARRLIRGHPVQNRQANGASVIELSRLGQWLKTPALVMPDEGIALSQRWRLRGHSWCSRRQTDSPLEVDNAGNG